MFKNAYKGMFGFNKEKDCKDKNTQEICFDEDGRMVTPENKEESYFDEDGRMITSESKEEACFDEDGKMITSESKEEACFDEDGKMVTQESKEESYFDEDGRMIIPESKEEAYFDEDGRMITPESKEEACFDEDGRMITPENNKEDDDNGIKETYIEDNVEELEEIEDLKMDFGLIYPNSRFVKTINEWDVEENQNGLFFISNTDSSILQKSIELKDSEGKIIWSSEVRELPEGKISSVNCASKKIYISKKVLRSSDIPNGDNTYFANIIDNDSDSSIVVININDMRNNNENQPIKLDMTKLINTQLDEKQKDEDSNQNNAYKIIENQNNLEDKEYEESNLEIENYIDYKKYDLEVENEIEYKETQLGAKNQNNDIEVTNDIENIGVIEYIEEVFESEREAEVVEKIEEVEKVVEKIVEVEKLVEVEKFVYPTDIKSVVIKSVLNHMPINIDCKKIEESIKLQYSIVIEKIGRYYIVTLNGIMNRPINLLNGDKQYFEFDKTLEEFITKICQIVCRMYSMTREEFDKMSTLLILDEKYDNQFENKLNLKVIQRDDLLSQIVNTNQKVIIDLLEDKCNIVFNDEDNNTVRIVSQGLGFENGESVLDSIKTLVDEVGEDKISLTGLFVDSNLYSKVKKEEDEIYSVDTLYKYISL